VPAAVEHPIPLHVVEVADDGAPGPSASGTVSAKEVATPHAAPEERPHTTDRTTVAHGGVTPDAGEHPPRARSDSQPDPNVVPDPPTGRPRPPASDERPPGDRPPPARATFLPDPDDDRTARPARHPGPGEPCGGSRCFDDRRPPDDCETRCDDGDACTLDRCRGTTCAHEPIPGSPAVCGVRGLVMARRRLLDAAPGHAFADGTSRSRVRGRLGRALGSVDRALARIDDGQDHGDAAHATTVRRRIDAYEARLRSRTVERGLVDPELTRSLHFPIGRRH
jgi:hypothetical protein